MKRSMGGTHSYNTTGIAARGRVYVGTDNKVYAFNTPGEHLRQRRPQFQALHLRRQLSRYLALHPESHRGRAPLHGRGRRRRGERKW
jgi:hypothetical protein